MAAAALRSYPLGGPSAARIEGLERQLGELASRLPGLSDGQRDMVLDFIEVGEYAARDSSANMRS
jgi:hypothetical protein